MPYARAGWQATLSTLAHDVEGTVTIVDEDTFRVDHFYFDGGGIIVYFYLAAADSKPAFTAGLETGPDLLGTPYTGGSITIDLPSGTTFDGYNAISVWCVAANANFGSGTFIGPLENWRKTHFSTTANSGNAADLFDYDKDGLVNLLEYATRTDPKVPNPSPWSAPEIVTLAGNVSARRFVFDQQPESRDIRYLVLSSSNLTDWTEIYRNDPAAGAVTVAEGVTSVEDPGAQTIQVTAPSSDTEHFWRLAVEPVN